jgi:penicillin-binding protein 1A
MYVVPASCIACGVDGQAGVGPGVGNWDGTGVGNGDGTGVGPGVGNWDGTGDGLNVDGEPVEGIDDGEPPPCPPP